MQEIRPALQNHRQKDGIIPRRRFGPVDGRDPENRAAAYACRSVALPVIRLKSMIHGGLKSSVRVISARMVW